MINKKAENKIISWMDIAIKDAYLRPKNYDHIHMDEILGNKYTKKTAVNDALEHFKIVILRKKFQIF